MTTTAAPLLPVTPARPPRRRWNRRLGSSIGWNLVGIAVVVVMIFPVFWMVVSSLKTGVNLRRVVPQWLPIPVNFDNYANAFAKPRFLGSLMNSLVVVTSVAVLSLVIGFLAAVALGRMNFKGRKLLIVVVIAIQMVPLEALIIPVFLMLNRAGLTDSAFGLILAYLSFVLPFTVWMLRGFIAAVPKDLEDAALVDGCSRVQAIRKIVLPLAAPGLVATTVFAVIQAWNEYLFALVLLKQNTKQTVTIWLDTFITTQGVDWGALMAASTVVALPIVILFAFIQRNVTAGITAGAVKG